MATKALDLGGTASFMHAGGKDFFLRLKKVLHRNYRSRKNGSSFKKSLLSFLP